MRRPGTKTTAGPPGCVATIGVFDGLHLGHQCIIRRVTAVAGERGLLSAVFSFEPTPREYFSRGEPPARLTSFREKFRLLDSLGVDSLLCPPFDATLASLPPEPFIERFLMQVLAVRHLVVGDDFRFARDRSGTVAHLQAAGRRHDFTVEQASSVIREGQRVSSTAVREALAAGDLARARDILGRGYSMIGRVTGGRRLGQRLGFPTANVDLSGRRSPVAGIFAVRVAGVSALPLNGVASVGTRPTVAGVEPVLEAHIFDFDRDIYGRYIQVEFVAKLRDEEHFPDLDSLQRQMRIDAARAREILDAA